MLEITPHTSRAAQQQALQSYRSGEENKRPPQTNVENPGVQADSVELSEAAQQYESERGPSIVRIGEVRAQIAADTYVTGDKIDYVVERLYETLNRSTARSA